MTEVTLADLDHLRQSLSAEIAGLRRDIDVRFAQVEAKLDAKPSIAALYQAVVTLMFGIGAVVTSTVVVLKNIGAMG
jgi:hypothetical protein